MNFFLKKGVETTQKKNFLAESFNLTKARNGKTKLCL
jgi:hypothetical protein